LFVLVVLTVELEVGKKALSEERTGPLDVDQSLAEEKAARRSIDQSIWASEEAKAALN
jgi:hypothetical protein